MAYPARLPQPLPARHTTRWVPLGVARDGDTASQWAAALDAAGLDAEVRIGDAVALARGSSSWPTAAPGGHCLFAYRLFVPHEQRREAAAMLVDLGWDGRYGAVGEAAGRPGDGLALRGALIATAAGALVALLVLRGT